MTYCEIRCDVVGNDNFSKVRKYNRMLIDAIMFEKITFLFILNRIHELISLSLVVF